MSNRLSNAILRGVTGAYVLNSGISKLSLDDEAAAGLQKVAAQGLPFVKGFTAHDFGKLLASLEIAVAAGLLTPFVNRRLAGLGLGAFAASLLSIYFRTPELTQEDGVRPSPEGIPISKDTWLAAIALALIVSGRDGERD